ncbi:hypothetical protein SKAU_G00152920 [Synaphobranchus kaupii]|uniref:Uncharacterized protein n=1 Tax=Synaphobranchus kaupii TaxID=118154 RepID=A0A9Q1FHF3_SYNKA|nr:hypothetical protein SKAU_G00152920 [Synaphobranchus kaupii]
MDDPVTKGNDRADAAAKEAADHTSALSCEEPVHKRQREKMVTKRLTAPEVMAPLLYLEKLPREDEHDLQDFAYTKECE